MPGTSRPPSRTSPSPPSPERRDPAHPRVVRKPRRGRPRPHPPKPEPGVDPGALPQRLDFRHEVIRGVVLEAGVRVARVRRAPAAAALIDQQDPIRRRIEVAAPPGGATGAGTAMEDDRRLA